MNYGGGILIFIVEKASDAKPSEAEGRAPLKSSAQEQGHRSPLAPHVWPPKARRTRNVLVTAYTKMTRFINTFKVSTLKILF